MKGSHLFWLSRSKGTTVDILIRDYNPPRCFQKKISGRSKHNVENGKQELYIGFLYRILYIGFLYRIYMGPT
jgi:hypothetical protein